MISSSRIHRRKVLDEDGKPYGLKGSPRYVEVEVQDIVIKEAVAFRPQRYISEQGKPYYNYKKQPYVHLEIKKRKSGGRVQFYIMDRKVVWDLIRCFDPKINFRLFLQIIEEFSLYKILDDFFHDYNDETIGLYFQNSRSRNNTTSLNHVVVGVEPRVGINAEDLGFHETDEYIMTKLNLCKAHHKECFMKLNKRRRRKTAVVRYKKAPYTIEISAVCGKPYDRSALQGNTQMRLFIDSDMGKAQVIPAVHWRKQLEFVESEKFYPEIDNAIEIITSKVFTTLPGKDFPVQWTHEMTVKEWDSIQHQHFLNYFIESK